MKLRKQISLFIITTLILSCNKNTEEVELNLAYNVGDKQTIVSTTETSRGALMSLKNTMETVFEVISIENKDINFKVNVARVMTEMKMGDEFEKYDSNKDKASMTSDEKSMHEEYLTILEPNFNIIINNKGDVVKSFHYEDGRIMNEPVVDIKNYFLSLPEGKVSEGSTWESEKLNPRTNQITTSTHTIKTITTDEIIISVKSEIPSITALLDKNTASGNYILDKTTCKLKKGSLKMNLQTGGSVTNTFISKN